MKKYEKMKVLTILLICITVFTACSSSSPKNEANGESFALQNQNGEEVTVPEEKPVILFFFTTYT